MPRATVWPSTPNFVILQTPSQIVDVGGYKKSRNFADELQSAAAQCRALFSQRCRLQRPNDGKSRRVRPPLRRRSEEASIQIRPSVVRTPPSPASQPSPFAVHGGMMQRSPVVRIELVGAGSGRKPLREILASRMLEEFQAVPSRSLGGNILRSVICRRLLVNAGNRQSAALMQSRRYRRLFVSVNLALQDCLHLLVLPFFSIQCQPKYAMHSLDWPAPRNFSRSFEWNRLCRPLR